MQEKLKPSSSHVRGAVTYVKYTRDNAMVREKYHIRVVQPSFNMKKWSPLGVWLIHLTFYSLDWFGVFEINFNVKKK